MEGMGSEAGCVDEQQKHKSMSHTNIRSNVGLVVCEVVVWVEGMGGEAGSVNEQFNDMNELHKYKEHCRACCVRGRGSRWGEWAACGQLVSAHRALVVYVNCLVACSTYREFRQGDSQRPGHCTNVHRASVG